MRRRVLAHLLYGDRSLTSTTALESLRLNVPRWRFH